MKAHTQKRFHIHTKKKPRKTRKTRIQAKDDFYTYVNQHWIQHHPFTAHENNIFLSMQNKTDQQLIALVQKTPALFTVYRSLLESTPQRASDAIQGIVAEMKSLFLQNDPCSFLAWMTRHGIGSPIQFNVVEDPKHNTSYLCTLEGGGAFSSVFTLDDPHAYTVQTKKKMRTYLGGLFSIALGTHHGFDVAGIYDIERNLIRYCLSVQDSTDMKKLYNVFTPQQIHRQLGFDFPRFAEILGITDHGHANNKVLIQNPRYIQEAVKQMHVSTPDWQTYWVYQVLRAMTPFHPVLAEKRQTFLSTFYILTAESKKKRALQFTQDVFHTRLNRDYVSLYKHVAERNVAMKLTQWIHQALKKRLQTNEWLSLYAKQRAIRKLDNMTFVIGYDETDVRPNPSLDPDPRLFSPRNGVQNQILYNEWLFQQNRENLSRPGRPKRDTDLNLFDVNAFYDVQRNHLTLPNAILSPPFTDLTKSTAYLFAHLGTTIGHEMMHAFDNDGFQYDADGNYQKHQMTLADETRYKERIRNVEKQYVAFAKRDGYDAMPTDLVVGENIADITGFLATEDALCEILSERNTSEEQTTRILKEFYKEYAQQWRTTLKPAIMSDKINDNVHTLAKYRVNCVLSRSKRFQTLFGIRPGDGMYTDIHAEIF